MRVGPSFIAAALAAGFTASGAAAHTVGWSLAPDSRAVVLQFNYGGDDPMAFAEVTVTAPDGRVFQQARADREGKFAFVAPAGGDAEAAANWIVEARDAEGHKIRAEVTPASPDRAASVRQSVSQMIGWVAMASVLFNVAFASALFSRRPRPLEIAQGQLRQI